MNILLSPDSFKGTLTSSEVCDIIESALRNRIPDCNVIKLPAADGGEGLCSSFANFIDGEWVSAESKDPFNSPMRAEYYMLKSGAAVIETASVPDFRSRATEPTRPLRLLRASVCLYAMP